MCLAQFKDPFDDEGREEDVKKEKETKQKSSSPILFFLEVTC